ncbi:group I truncated hemoglobin [Photobacterium ganghwense]|uniref:group I truncated hemoglobin n=1 Tax=Photobacterium ganghwense TaxID=320778 RepID=UPI001C2D25DE|nr:group 1 truncated hemoglobin [Photobacterium ganghwense]MBV1842448.1 group 1 truncated hemoglobin [Photobacterium ganghwense]
MFVQRKFCLKSLCLLGPLLAGTVAATVSAEEAKEPSLYDRLGGLSAISVVVDDFINVMVVDDVLNANPAIDAARKKVPSPYLKYQVTSMVCKATGGPCAYTGRTMEEAHSHLNITLEEWQRMVQLLRETFNKYQIPEKEQEDMLEVVYSTKAAIVKSAEGSDDVKSE